MDIYASEKEQVESLKKWFKENGSSMATGVILALGIVFGGRAWFSYQDGISGQASDNYAQMIVALSENKSELVLQKGGILINNFSKSPYASLAALAMAKVAVDEGDSGTARNHLNWAMLHGKPESVKQTALVRLVQLQIEDGKLDDARQLLQGADKSGPYQAQIDELWGDYWVAMSNPERAAEAYRAAMAGSRPRSQNKLFLQLKLDDTGHALDEESNQS